MARGKNSATSAGSDPSTDDSSSPFFLHPADHPGLVLVAHPLSGPNYHTWRRSMIMALQAKNKYQFVDGSLPLPSTDDLLYSCWVRCNSMVSSWIFHAVERDIPTASAIWADLRDRFEQSNTPRIFQLKSQLAALRQGYLDVSAYYTRLKTLWDGLREFQSVPSCNCGGLRTFNQYQEQDSSIQFLMGLNESYAATRAQILLLEPLPPLTRVFSLVVQEERQRSIMPAMSPVPELQLLPAVNATTGPPASSPRPRRDRPYCTHCSQQGHTVEKCFKLHGYPPGYRTWSKPNDDPAHPIQGHLSAATSHHIGPLTPQTSPPNPLTLTSDQLNQI